MTKTPQALRIHIGIFGRTNTGKSSLFNLILGQSHAIVADKAGTTTDAVTKSMEFFPLGPVSFIDTAGIDDSSDLGRERIKKTDSMLHNCDVILLTCLPNEWTSYEQNIADFAKRNDLPIIGIITHVDVQEVQAAWKAELPIPCLEVCSKAREVAKLAGSAELAGSVSSARRSDFLNALAQELLKLLPEHLLQPPPLLGDLIPHGGPHGVPNSAAGSNLAHAKSRETSTVPLVVLLVPIDLGAPKGRLIMPQVQSIRDALDFSSAVCVVKDSEYKQFLNRLKDPPELVVCDSQIAHFAAKTSPQDTRLTTFSILFSRAKGDIRAMAEGAARMVSLKDTDRILIAEACTHHETKDDIGTVKIPKWLKDYIGEKVQIDHCRGKDFPHNLKDYSLIIHCGACSLTRREMLHRIQLAQEAGVPITNYGIAISALQGVAPRMLEPFPTALEAWQTASAQNRSNQAAPSNQATRTTP